MSDSDVAEGEISIRPGPGTCCPKMKVVDGQCKSCGHVHDVNLARAEPLD
jgi:hypothetical protein